MRLLGYTLLALGLLDLAATAWFRSTPWLAAIIALPLLVAVFIAVHYVVVFILAFVITVIRPAIRVVKSVFASVRRQFGVA